MVLQAHKLGWHAHGMVGLDRERARASLNITDDMVVEAAFAIGRGGEKERLPEALRS
jgi:hypothetical protein